MIITKKNTCEPLTVMGLFSGYGFTKILNNINTATPSKMVNKHTYIPICDKAELKEMYTNKGMTIKEIADFLLVGQKPVYTALKHYGIKRRVAAKRNQTGENNDNWKGGRTKHSDGYVYVRQKNHPRSNPNGYVLEHILVVEKIVGRSLAKDEIIHHVNGNKSDNRPENLKITTYAKHFLLHGRNKKGHMKSLGGDADAK